MTDDVFNAGVDRVCGSIDRLTDVFGALLAALAAEPEQPAAGCQHPEDARIPFGRTKGIEDFQCRLCGYRASEAVPV